MKPAHCRQRPCQKISVVRAALTGPPPRPSSKHQLRMKNMFEDTHMAMLEMDAHVLDVPFMLSRQYYFRHPDDVQQILTGDGVFRKSQRVAQSKEWLGSGIFSQLDYEKHAAMRQTLNPAFRMGYLKQLDTFFLASASALADVLKQHAARNDKQGGNNSGQDLDMQKLFRLCTLDSIGLTSMRHSFQALGSWQQQQQKSRQQESDASSSSTNSSSATGADVHQMLLDLSAAFAWQSLVLPVPRSWLPGWGAYIAACEKLDNVWRGILQERRAAVAPAVGLEPHKQDLLGFLLQAQQHQGVDVITDEMIGDEVKTVMFAGSDTSSFTMAMMAHYLAAHPEVADSAAQEVQQLLSSRGGDVTQLCADDMQRLPYLTACVNETLRLAPAGPVVTRTAQQDTEVGGYHIPKGLVVVANIYAMHRTPEYWPRPDEFIPERWLPEGASAGLTPTAKNAFLPFAAGSRSCIGRSYAMLQMVLTWALLLGQGIRLRCAQNCEEPLLAKGITMYAVEGVYLRPELL